MTEDRFVVRQLADVWQRSMRRDTCPLDTRGRQITLACGKSGRTPEPEKPKTPYELTPELTPLEEAVVKLLPKWPDALEAVFAYAMDKSGIPRSDPVRVPPQWQLSS